MKPYLGGLGSTKIKDWGAQLRLATFYKIYEKCSKCMLLTTENNLKYKCKGGAETRLPKY